MAKNSITLPEGFVLDDSLNLPEGFVLDSRQQSALEPAEPFSTSDPFILLEESRRLAAKELDKWADDKWESRIPDYKEWLLSPEEQRKELAELPKRKARIEDDEQYMYSEMAWGMRGDSKRLAREQLAKDEARITRGAKPMTTTEKFQRKWTSPETILAGVIPFNPFSAVAETEAYEPHQRL